MSEQARTPVAVQIQGEEYSIRADAPAEYTRECAEYLDRAIAEVLRRGSLVEGHKAAILAGLALADQVFRARAETAALRDELARRSSDLAAIVENGLVAKDLVAKDLASVD